MALINCPECGKEISDKAKSCPNCGYEIKKAKISNGIRIPIKKIFSKSNIIILGVILLVCLGLVIWTFANNFWEKDNVKNCLQSGKISCLFIHSWVDKDCENPRHCEKCGLKDGEAAGHKWEDATCIKAKQCEVCNKISGSALGHDYEITVTKGGQCLEVEELLKKCKRCGKETKETYTVEHEWVTATCENAKYCKKCNAEDGVALGHTTDNGTCSRCGQYIEKIYEAGEKWVVDSEWEFWMVAAERHSFCNSYSNKFYNYDQNKYDVVIIKYAYKNIGYQTNTEMLGQTVKSDLIFTSLSLTPYDGTGMAADTYACVHGINPDQCVVGTGSMGTIECVVPKNITEVLLRVEHETSNYEDELTAMFSAKVEK